MCIPPTLYSIPVGILDLDLRTERIHLVALTATQQHHAAVLRMRIGRNVAIDGGLAAACGQQGAVHLLPHVDAVLDVVRPADVQLVVLARQRRRLGYPLRPVAVAVPLPARELVEAAR